MKRSFKEMLRTIKLAHSFAIRLFKRTDVRFVKYKTFSECFKTVVPIFSPIVFAYVAQWLANTFSRDRIIPFSHIMWAAIILIVYIGGAQYFSNLMVEFSEMFRERVKYNLDRRILRKLGSIRYSVLLDPESVNVIHNASFDYHELEDLAMIKIRLLLVIVAVCLGIGLSIFANPLISIVCFIMTYMRSSIKGYFWKKAEDLRDSMVEDERKSDNYCAHKNNVDNYVQFSVWGFIHYMNRNYTIIKRRVMKAKRSLFRAERRALVLWTPLMLAISMVIVLWAAHDSFSKSQSLLMLGIWFSAYRSTTGSLDELFSFWRSARRNTREFERYSAFMNLPERRKDLPGLRESEKYSVCLDDVTFTYPGRSKPAINGLSLMIQHGERLAITGRNGSGKTTLLSILCGFVDPKSGNVSINGTNLQNIDIASWHDVVGCVMQTSDICMTIGELVSGNQLNEVSEPIVWESLELVGLETEVKELSNRLRSRIGEAWSDGTDFSTGQRQKLRLAVVVYKVLAEKVKVIILDEPTANLDVESKVAVINALAKLGITLIVSLHDKSLLPHFTRIIELGNGRLISDCLIESK
jgi:ABC-type multidrug transport system fused ATPase/permease subunit